MTRLNRIEIDHEDDLKMHVLKIFIMQFYYRMHFIFVQTDCTFYYLSLL